MIQLFEIIAIEDSYPTANDQIKIEHSFKKIMSQFILSPFQIHSTEANALTYYRQMVQLAYFIELQFFSNSQQLNKFLPSEKQYKMFLFPYLLYKYNDNICNSHLFSLSFSNFFLLNPILSVRHEQREYRRAKSSKNEQYDVYYNHAQTIKSGPVMKLLMILPFFNPISSIFLSFPSLQLRIYCPSRRQTWKASLWFSNAAYQQIDLRVLLSQTEISLLFLRMHYGVILTVILILKPIYYQKEIYQQYKYWRYLILEENNGKGQMEKFSDNFVHHCSPKVTLSFFNVINNLNLTTERMNQYSVDDTLDLLKEFLPDIESELRDQLESELQDQYQSRKEEAIKAIQQQAEKEYLQALATMEEEVEDLKSEKEHQLQKELVHLQQMSHEKEKQMLAKAQEKFLQEHFDDKILTHAAFRQFEEDLQTEIAESLFEKYSSIRDKRVKQLRVRLQNKEQKQRSQADKAIKQNIYNQSGLSQIREDLNKFKINIAAQKSQYNIKISKLSTQIKALQAKCKQIQYANSDLLIEQLQRQIQQIRQQQSQRQQKAQRNANDSSLLNLHHTNARFGVFEPNPRMSFGINPMKSDDFNEQTNFVNQDFSMDSSDSLDQSNSIDMKGLLPPPSRSQRTNNQFNNRNEQQESNDEQIYIELPPKPLLSFNVGKMLREKWQEDSFDRFLSKKSQKEKENVQNANNQPQSNFQSLYTEHLKKLNRDTKAPKLRKLSEKAKQQIIANLSSNHSYRQQYYL